MGRASIARIRNGALPILFAYIGWAERYDGTEPIKGGFSHFKKKSADISEACAFYRDGDGLYRCGVGRGDLGEMRLNVVLVARENKHEPMRIVGLYPFAKIEMEDYWAVAACNKPILIPPKLRPKLKHWPAGQGLRRWAWRGGEVGKEYPELRKIFEQVVSKVPASLAANQLNGTAFDFESDGFEGIMKRRFVAHRSRENRLRHEKIRDALIRNKGKLVCEVPRCGFDFEKRYGTVGAGYAHVHHRKQLSSVPITGVRTRLSDLAVVCANCHAMIHKGGECRSLKGLIPR